VVLFKLLLIGYAFGICSERQLMREEQCNAALPLESEAEVDRQSFRRVGAEPESAAAKSTRNCLT
jgi:transposase